MKIAYVLDDTLDKSDGVQQAVITIGEHMRGIGHDVHYIVPTTERTDIMNIHVVAEYISMKFNGNSVRTPKPASNTRIKQLLAQEKFDVIHVQMPYSPFLAGRVIKHAPKGTKIVGTFHILPFDTKTRIGTKLLGLFLRHNSARFTKVYGVSQPAVDFMQHTFGLKGDVLGNPIDYDFFNTHGKRHEKQPVKRIVFVGRFDERKGVRQLVDAFSRMKHNSNVEFIMCGKGPLLDEVQKQANAYGLQVQFPGFVSEEEKAHYLGSATIAVFPSISGESFGIVLTEAMASGADVTIGGNNPGYASVLHPWHDVLFDPTNPEEIAKKLDDLATDPSDRERIGTEQHEYVKNFDISVIARRLLDEAYL